MPSKQTHIILIPYLICILGTQETCQTLSKKCLEEFKSNATQGETQDRSKSTRTSFCTKYIAIKLYLKTINDGESSLEY